MKEYQDKFNVVQKYLKLLTMHSVLHSFVEKIEILPRSVAYVHPYVHRCWYMYVHVYPSTPYDLYMVYVCMPYMVCMVVLT